MSLLLRHVHKTVAKGKRGAERNTEEVSRKEKKRGGGLGGMGEVEGQIGRENIIIANLHVHTYCPTENVSCHMLATRKTPSRPNENVIHSACTLTEQTKMQLHTACIIELTCMLVVKGALLRHWGTY
jgi:hypothetical protein